MKNISVLSSYFLLILLLNSCQNESATKQAPQPQNAEAAVTQNMDKKEVTEPLFIQYFTPEEQEVLLKMKTFYENGISDDFTFEKIGEAYEYNSNVLRGDLFNKIPHTLTFPYNGEFALSMFEQDLSKLSFITKKCGFQDAKTEEIINYHCLSLDEDFFAYLEKVAEGSSLIKNFHEEYMSQKVISNGMKENMILRSTEDLDVSNFNHQLFYMLFHVFVNEEQKAMEKIR